VVASGLCLDWRDISKERRHAFIPSSTHHSVPFGPMLLPFCSMPIPGAVVMRRQLLGTWIWFRIVSYPFSSQEQ